MNKHRNFPKNLADESYIPDIDSRMGKSEWAMDHEDSKNEKNETKVDFGHFSAIDASSSAEFDVLLDLILSSKEGTGKPSEWEAVASGMGTHALKLTDSRIKESDGQPIIFSPSASRDDEGHETYSGNGALVGYAKILSARISHPSDNRVELLVDRIGTDHPAGLAFRKQFGDEATEAVVRGRSRKSSVDDVTRVASPLVKGIFLPDGSGGYFSASPVSSNTSFVNLALLFKQKSAEEYIPSCTVMRGSK
jgi:hypothetical protein